MNDITVIGQTKSGHTLVSLPSNALETINAQQHTNPLDEQHVAADSIQGFSKAVAGRDETIHCGRSAFSTPLALRRAMKTDTKTRH